MASDRQSAHLERARAAARKALRIRDKDRNRDIRRMSRQRMSPADIAALYGISRQRVYQILAARKRLASEGA